MKCSRTSSTLCTHLRCMPTHAAAAWPPMCSMPACMVLVQGTSNTNSQKSELRALYILVSAQLKMYHSQWAPYLKKIIEPALQKKNGMPDEPVTGAETQTEAASSPARSVRSRTPV